MVLWRKGGNYAAREYTVMVTPGALFPETSDFMDGSGKPVQFNIIFRYGKTDNLPDNLARYLIDNNLAQETRFIL